MNNIEWKELNLKAPFFLFVPQDENKKVEYDKGYSVKDMFRISSTGICSQRDSVVIHKTKESVKEIIKDFCNLSKEENIKKYKIEKDGRDWQIQLAIDSVKKSELNKNGVIIQINYRPFDFYWTYYNEEAKGFMAYPRTEVMQHFLPSIARAKPEAIQNIDCHASKEARNDNNIGLVINRSVALDKYQHAFITNKITDLHIMETANASAYVFPLYIYDTANVRKILREENEEVGGMFEDIKHFENDNRIENFTPKFRQFINEKYGEIKPEEILGYIYAVLFHKEYRKKYFDFLKIDFPKIPFVDRKEDFLKFAKLGEKLYNLHLGDLKIQKEVGEPMFKDNQNKNEKIAKAIYNEKDKNLFVNESLYFKNVDKEVWEYKIGGYQVLDKYLKSHKNENIDYEYFENVIKILASSIEIEAEISKLDF